MVELGWIRY